ncbi:MAG TPA: NUDIX domain-containing protein [Ramlibacter sp.]|uniref:NUDIX hydrolase n=1 Tax=Ramlibacter sp. TaxID=1917967 RepID=UPI002D34DE8B|nr:NUDIX domain-containing protein [Ramlibacter sp.]HZY17449.1 NUDIX domain-containing protein [Ramlibacter sp.]
MTAATGLPADWLDGLARRLDQPPARPRRPLCWRGTPIGSVDPAFLDALPPAARRCLLEDRQDGTRAVALDSRDLTAVLADLALHMREAGLASAWRDEQLAVTVAGEVLGTVERAAVRPLGIATQAVHLAGRTPDGRHWVQQRALDKPNDPGLWDTLMGGMVPATDTPQMALARETWEEAGLHLDQLVDLEWGGRFLRRGPSSSTGLGYVVETVDWYRCVVPDGVTPCNQDGEVAQFALLQPAELRQELLRGRFTLEAEAVLAATGA